jgi:2-aminoadipate transaminase
MPNLTTDWSDRYARRTRNLAGSTIRELLKYTQRPEMISFAGGMPAPELFPQEQFREAACRILTNPAAGQSALQYGPTEGYLPLREMIARHTSRYGIDARPENVLITTGSQQALDLVGKLFINPGDRILVEAPTYLGALQAFDLYGAAYASVPIDEDGLKTDDASLSAAQAGGAKFMYLLPNFQNPSGVTLSLDRRQSVVALGGEFGIPIVEDDPYGQLRYEGVHLPPLLKVDRELRLNSRTTGWPSSNVIYLSTFSKTLAPGLRVGWMIAPPEVIARLIQLKQGADLQTSTFIQQLVYEVARGGFLDAHIRMLRQAYRERRDVMLATLADTMPPTVTWTRPAGGLFVWLRLPAGMDSQSLLQAALQKDVAFVPGSAFFADKAAGRRYCRLNFSNAQPDRIREGIQRLADLVHPSLAMPAAVA